MEGTSLSCSSPGKGPGPGWAHSPREPHTVQERGRQARFRKSSVGGNRGSTRGGLSQRWWLEGDLDKSG